MSLNTLLTTVSGIIKASHITDILSALRLQFVGRNSLGVPASGQDLGTATYPWGDCHISNLLYNGVSVAPDLFDSAQNRITSGKVRSTSNQPDFLRCDGAADECDILATATDLELIINNVSVTVSADITLTSLTLAPGSNNTALVDDTNLTGQLDSKYTGEGESKLLLDTVGSEISDRHGLFVALKGATEIMFGTVIDFGGGHTEFKLAYRGYFFDSSGDPIEREALTNNDTLTLMNIGWIFIQDNGTTTDVSYITPITSKDEPTLGLDGNALIDGQYWFDIANDTWKRYSTVEADFETLNRILLGMCVMDDTNCVAARPADFTKFHNEYNGCSVRTFNSDEMGSKNPNTSLTVYGSDIEFISTDLKFNRLTDMETGSVAADTLYYLYITDEGDQKISLTKWHTRADLKGRYHPYNTWRAIGEVLTRPGTTNFTTQQDFSRNYNNSLKYNELITKKVVIEVPDWDMDADATKSISIDAGSINLDKFVSMQVWIIKDDFVDIKPLNIDSAGTGTEGSFYIDLANQTIELARIGGGTFDTTDYNENGTTLQNRGWIELTLFE